MGTRTVQRTITAEELSCDFCGTKHYELGEVDVSTWVKTPRTVTEDPVTQRPIVTDAVMGDPLVLCREPKDCVKRLAKYLRRLTDAERAAL